MLEIEEGEGTCWINTDIILHPVQYQYVLICNLGLKDNRVSLACRWAGVMLFPK